MQLTVSPSPVQLTDLDPPSEQLDGQAAVLISGSGFEPDGFYTVKVVTQGGTMFYWVQANSAGNFQLPVVPVYHVGSATVGAYSSIPSKGRKSKLLATATFSIVAP